MGLSIKPLDRDGDKKPDGGMVKYTGDAEVFDKPLRRLISAIKRIIKRRG
jgi:hypothetical protein